MPSFGHDVFLSYRSDPVDDRFTRCLTSALLRYKFTLSSSCDLEFQRASHCSTPVRRSIEEAKTSIVVLSENYASSTHCLDELVKIIECKKKKNQQVLPIFYKVDQSDVRHQRNSYGKAMDELEKRYGKDSEKLKKWRSALFEATNLPGLTIQDDKYINEFTQGIVGWVTHSIQRDPVFLASRMEETYHFTRFLYNALCWEGFNTFMDHDHEILEVGNQKSDCIDAIEESRLSIVVFSENYASSSHCLDELTKIYECMRLKQQRVLPIFYKVEPRDVRYQNEGFGKALAIHEERLGKDSEKIKKWRSALFEVSNFSGLHFKTGMYEYITIKNIVKFVNQFLARYDVFLSFRGKDTRYTFTGYLYHALCEKGIKTFMDHEALNGGDHISPSIMKAIEEARISVVVLSEDFASSSSCLNELVKIVECMKTKGQLVLPIYFKVKLLDVRHQRNSYEKAMAKHESMLGKDSKKVREWRSALSDATYLRGWHFKTGHECELIEMIVERVNGHCDQCVNSLASARSWLSCRL